jgi:hypothetical protein
MVSPQIQCKWLIKMKMAQDQNGYVRTFDGYQMMMSTKNTVY